MKLTLLCLIVGMAGLPQAKSDQKIDSPELDRWDIAGLNDRAEAERLYAIVYRAVDDPDEADIDRLFSVFTYFRLNCEDANGDIQHRQIPTMTKAEKKAMWRKILHFWRVEDDRPAVFRDPDEVMVNYRGIGLMRGTLWINGVTIKEAVGESERITEAYHLSISSHLPCAHLIPDEKADAQ